jgi:hypothetical protein
VAALLPHSVVAQATCHLSWRGDTAYVGSCVQAKETLAVLSLRRPAATELSLFRGLRTAPIPIDRIALDTSSQPTYRDGRFWRNAQNVRASSTELNFTVDAGSATLPSDVDERILKRAREFLSDPSHWDHAADPEPEVAVPQFTRNPTLTKGGYCPTGSARTLFCALYDASIAEAGEFWFGRPAIDAVRASVLVQAPGLRHPLMEFNGAAQTGHDDVLRMLDVAIAFLRQRRSCAAQYWTFGPAYTHCR